LQVTVCVWCVALGLATNLINKTGDSSFASDFPKGKSEAMNYTRCYHTFFLFG